jgi:hypothetical protein
VFEQALAGSGDLGLESLSQIKVILFGRFKESG